MECFIIFVMAWCWFNATESKPQNVGRQFGGAKKHTSIQFNYKKNYSDRRKKYSDRRKKYSNREKNYSMQV